MRLVINVPDDVKESYKTQRKIRRKKRFQKKVNNVKQWLSDNKGIIIFLTPAIIGITASCIKTAERHSRLKKEKEVKDLFCYDRSLGHYWALRRKLTNKEWTEIDSRKNNGERLADILDDLKVLK